MRSLLLSLVVLSALSATAGAQEPNAQTREGFGISVGVGAGIADISCDGCTFDAETGLSGYLRMGGHIRPNLFIGGETTGWLKNDVDGADVRVSFLSAVAQWYPRVEKGFYLKGGLGVGLITAEDATNDLESTGLALTAGAGYDWRVRPNMSVTPYVNYLRKLDSELKFNGADAGFDLGTGLLQIGVGLTWH